MHGNLPVALSTPFTSPATLQLTDDACKTECNGRPADLTDNRLDCWGDFSWSCAKNESQYTSLKLAAICNGCVYLIA